ncbi:MAG: hypothetical protein U0169_25640 [Polyangiaceae bacterium]
MFFRSFLTTASSFLLASIVSGCAVDASDSDVSDSDLGTSADALRIVNGRFVFASPGSFDLGKTVGETVPETGCNLYTALSLMNAPLAEATVGLGAGANQLGMVCPIAALAPKSYVFDFARIDDCGVKIYRGFLKGAANPSDPANRIEVLDRRANRCAVPAIWPPPSSIELTVAGGTPSATRAYSRLPYVAPTVDAGAFPMRDNAWFVTPTEGCDTFDTLVLEQGGLATARFSRTFRPRSPGAICPLGMPMPREYVLTSSRTNECGIVTYQGRSRISGAALTLVDNRENVCPTFVQLPSVESVETTDSGETRLFAQLAP